MKKLLSVALAALAFLALPAAAQDADVDTTGEYARVVARGNPLDYPPGVYAYAARRAGDFFAETKGARTIYADALRARIDANEPMLIVDVRDPITYAAGHVPGAVNIPLEVLFRPENLDLLPTDGTPIVLVCVTGHTASMAMGGLAVLGYNPFVLRFGFMGWSASTKMKVWSASQTKEQTQAITGLGGTVAK
jgi:rhodanese-related sulfurtransferase